MKQTDAVETEIRDRLLTDINPRVRYTARRLDTLDALISEEVSRRYYRRRTRPFDINGCYNALRTRLLVFHYTPGPTVKPMPIGRHAGLRELFE